MPHETTESTSPERTASDSIIEVQPTRTRSVMDTTPIDLGHIEVLQILDEHAQVDDALDPGYAPEQLLRMHRGLVLTRAFDQRMLTMQRQGEMGTFAPNLGQEACQLGQVIPLTRDDWYSPSYRSFGAQIWRGWSMERLFKLWSGYHEGFPPPPDVNDLPFSIVIGSHVLPAVGVAMGMRYRNEPHCMVVNYGDGASSQGAVSEAMNFAAVNKAPVVFVCENNGWAISTPLGKQSATSNLAVRGIGFGVPTVRVDGNDILAMTTAVEQAANRARNGEGPMLIEAITYRMSLHTTADDPTVYRSQELVDPWEARCPIVRFETYLQRKGILDAEGAERVRAECDAEVIAARDRFRTDAVARPREIFDHIYGELPAELEAQKQAYLDRLDRKGVE
ncbi:MAG: thiamine pyrophosphate-dependent dehydrogenase E1 component subunit alpha [Planctomycetota bacterium]|nr:thiamine pyrophosphate-dependent dehydrogenase E1 component subunit alpha [Planctomycetota bacterium]